MIKTTVINIIITSIIIIIISCYWRIHSFNYYQYIQTLNNTW